MVLQVKADWEEFLSGHCARGLLRDELKNCRNRLDEEINPNFKACEWGGEICKIVRKHAHQYDLSILLLWGIVFSFRTLRAEGLLEWVRDLLLIRILLRLVDLFRSSRFFISRTKF